MIVMTDNLKLRKKLIKALKQNGGYCPCMVEHIPDNACKCKEFRDMVENGVYGECRCGLWINKEM